MGFSFCFVQIKCLLAYCKIFVTNVVPKLVFQDEEGNVIFETNSFLVGKIIEVRFNLLY